MTLSKSAIMIRKTKSIMIYKFEIKKFLLYIS